MNRFMQTSRFGDICDWRVAEFEGQTVGTTPAAEAQARALAEYLRGNEHAPFRGFTAANILKLPGLPLAAAGVTEPAGDEAGRGNRDVA